MYRCEIKYSFILQEYIDDSPMTEFESWQKQESEYKSLTEQLGTPFVVAVIGRYFNNVKNLGCDC